MKENPRHPRRSWWMPVVAGVLLAAGSGIGVSRADGGGESVGPGFESPLSANSDEMALIEKPVTRFIDPKKDYQGMFPDGYIVDDFQERDTLDGENFFSTGAETESGMERMNIWIIQESHIEWLDLGEVVEGDEILKMRKKIVKLDINTYANMVTQIFSDRVGIRLTWSLEGKSYLLSGNFSFTNTDQASQVNKSEEKMIDTARSTLPMIETHRFPPPATPY